MMRKWVFILFYLLNNPDRAENKPAQIVVRI